MKLVENTKFSSEMLSRLVSLSEKLHISGKITNFSENDQDDWIFNENSTKYKIFQWNALPFGFFAWKNYNFHENNEKYQIFQ